MNIEELLDHRTGMIAVKKGLMTHEELYLAIKKQKKILSETKIFTPVCDILFNKKEIENQKIEKPVLELFIPDDKMAAILSIRGENRASATADDINTFLEDKGIKYRILQDDSIARHLDKIDDQDITLRVASGKMPSPEIPEEIEYFFDSNPLRIGTLTEKGTMDWKERGKVAQVDEETLLAEIKPGKEGTPGIDIYGQPVLFENHRINIVCGEGARQTEDGKKIYSTGKGKPIISADGQIMVLPVLKIGGDVGVKTGHVDFDGHVEVNGVIQKGYQVKAKSLNAMGIQDAEILILNDIIISEGIFGARIRNNGSIKAGHIHKTDIIVSGDIVVGTEITDSIIETSGRCIINGSIFASEISAKKGVESENIGSESAGPSKLTIGVDFKAKREKNDLKNRIAKNQKELAGVESTIITLKEESDLLNIKLGEIAQVQDKYIVEHRKLIELSETDISKANELEKNIHAIDKEVAKLINEDEQVIEQIKETEFIINGCKDQVNEFKKKIDEINKKSESDKTVAIVKASGKIYQGTRINGRNSSINIEEIVQCATISEKKVTSPGAGHLWKMKISAR